MKSVTRIFVTFKRNLSDRPHIPKNKLQGKKSPSALSGKIILLFVGFFRACPSHFLKYFSGILD